MKKLFVIGAAALAACTMAFGAVACGSEAKDYQGSYSHKNAWDSSQSYAANVTVTVKGGKITKVVLAEDTDTVHNVTPTWGDKKIYEDSIAECLKAFEGKKVADVQKWTVATNTDGTIISDDAKTPDVNEGEDTIKADSDVFKTGATQSYGRLILAVKDAIKDIK